MAEPLLDRLAGGLLRRRGLALAGLIGLVVATSLHIPSLKADFTPSALFARFDDQEAVAADFQADFGNTDSALLVLVQSPAPLSATSLQYVHDLSRDLQARGELFASVQSVTLTPVPRRTPGAGQGVDLSRLDPKAAALVGMNPALLAMMAAAPRGKGDVSRQRLMIEVATGNARLDPMVAGDVVTDQEAAHIAQVLPSARLLRRRLVGERLGVLAIALVLRREIQRNDEVSAAVRSIEALLASRPPPQGVGVELAGLPFVRHQVVSKMRSDQSVLLPASILVCLLIMALSFRWWPALTLPLGVVIASALLLVGGMALFGEPFNIINNIAPLLIIIIGLSDSIHLIHRYGESLAQGMGQQQAVRHTLAAMAVACFLTSWTTAVGFLSLAVSRTEILGRFGIVAGIGVMVVFVVTIVALPLGLSFFKAPDPARLSPREGRLERAIGRLTLWLLRHRWPVLAASALIAAASIWGASTLKVDNAVLDQFDEDDPVATTARLLEREFGGVRPLELRLVAAPGRFNDPATLEAVERLQGWIAQQPGALATTSYVDFLRELWFVTTGDPSVRTDPFEARARVQALSGILSQGQRDPMAPWVTPDRSRARISVQLEDVGAQATIALCERLRERAAAELGPLGGIEVQLTGDAYIGSQGLDLVIRDLLASLMTALLVIFVFMTLLLRSVRLGLLSVPPNVVPLAVTMSYMVARQIPLNAATVIIFSISVGLAVDGTIHMIARFREELGEGRADERDSGDGVDEPRIDDPGVDDPDVDDPVDRAIVRSAQGTGKAIILTCLSLVLGFGVLLLSAFPPVRRFGELIAVTVVGCLLATIIVLPPLLKIGTPARRPPR